jgi:hypothetical protein
MGRLPLSDEFDPDEVVEEEGTIGPEEQYDELDFDADSGERGYEPEDWDDEWSDDPLNSGGWGEGDDA